MDIRTRLAQDEVIIIDGAMGTELQRRGVPMSTEVWTGAGLLTDPDIIRDIHTDYARTGGPSHVYFSGSTRICVG